MGWNAKMVGRAFPARSYCPRHGRLVVGLNGEGENVAKLRFWKSTPLQSENKAILNRKKGGPVIVINEVG